MAKLPKYRMQVVFDLRETAKEEAEAEYAERKAELAAEEQKLEGLKQELRDMIAAREEKKHEYAEKLRQGAFSIQQIQGNDRHIERMKSEEQAFEMTIFRQQEVCEEKQGEVDQAMEKMLEATQEFKALEKHKEKWLKQVKAEQMKKAEEEAEDISQAQYFKRMKEGR